MRLWEDRTHLWILKHLLILSWMEQSLLWHLWLEWRHLWILELAKLLLLSEHLRLVTWYEIMLGH